MHYKITYKVTIETYVPKNKHKLVKRLMGKMLESKSIFDITLIDDTMMVEYRDSTRIALSIIDGTLRVTISSNSLDNIAKKANEYAEIINDFLKEQEE